MKDMTDTKREFHFMSNKCASNLTGFIQIKKYYLEYYYYYYFTVDQQDSKSPFQGY